MESLVIHTVSEAVEILRIGRSQFYELMGAGEVRSFKIGSRRLIKHEDLQAFIERQLESAE